MSDPKTSQVPAQMPPAAPAELVARRDHLIRALESHSKSASKMSALLTSIHSGKGFDAKVHQEVREAFSQQTEEAGRHPEQAKVSPILNESLGWMESYLKSRASDPKAALPAELKSSSERIIRELDSSAKSTSKMAALLTSTQSGFDAKVHQEVREAFTQQAEEASKHPEHARVSPILNESLEWMESYLKSRGVGATTSSPSDLESRRQRIIRELESHSKSTSKMAALLTSTQTGFDGKLHQEVRDAFTQQTEEASKNPQQAKVSPILNEALGWMESYTQARARDPKAALSAELKSAHERIVRELESNSKSTSKMAALLTSSAPGASFDAKAHQEVREAFSQQADEASKNPQQARVSPILNEAVEWMQESLKSRGVDPLAFAANDLESRRHRLIRELESNAKSASKMAALLTSTQTGFDGKLHQEVREAFTQQAEEASKNPQQAKVSPILNESVEWMESYLKSRASDPKASVPSELSSRRERIVRELESQAKSASKMAALLSSTGSGSGFDAKIHEEVREAFSQQAESASKNPEQARVSPVLNAAVEWMQDYLQSRGAGAKAASPADLESKRQRIIRELESTARSASKMAALLTSSAPGASFDPKIHQEVREAFSQQADEASQHPEQARFSPILNEAVEWMQEYLKARGAGS